MFAYEFAKALKRPGIPQGFITMSSGRGGRNRQLASPLSWTSFRGVKDLDSQAFRARLNELFLQYPNSAVARKAAAQHVAEVKKFVRGIQNSERQGHGTATFALQAPAFPEPGKGEEVPQDTIPTYAYNWNVSPLTPMALLASSGFLPKATLAKSPGNMLLSWKSMPGVYPRLMVSRRYSSFMPSQHNLLLRESRFRKSPGRGASPSNNGPRA